MVLYLMAGYNRVVASKLLKLLSKENSESSLLLFFLPLLLG